jgi:hypothetical protein
MTGYQYTDDDYDEQEEPVKQNPVKDLRKQLSAKDKELKELREKFEGLDRAARQRTAAEELEARNADKRYARFLLADQVDPSDKVAVDRWVNENADLLGVEVRQADSIADEDVDAANRQERITRPRGQGGDTLANHKKTIDSFGPGDKEKLDAWIASQGALPGV